MREKQEQWFEKLRRMADQRIKKRSDHLKAPDSGDLNRLIDDIQVFQVELELQNEEHRRKDAFYGYFFERQGKGDHEIWYSPVTEIKFVVDNAIRSRHTANAVLKQAGLPKKF